MAKQFKVGVSDSFFQSCGLGLNSSDWHPWSHETDAKGKPRIEGESDLSKIFIDYLENPQIVVEKLKTLGATTYRFSLERAALEPKEGVFDAKFIQKYRHFIELLKANGIEAMLTLHHFVNPRWFFEKGGFEKEENIESFVLYAEKMFQVFGDLVSHWITVNEAAMYSCQSYFRGEWPPGKKNLKLAWEVLKNLLIAHCRIYESAKKINPSLHIGMSHNWMELQPYSPFNPIERLVCHYLSEFYHRCVVRFFQTGVFSLRIPFMINKKYEDSKAKGCLDFLGVQYYSKPLIKIGLFSAASTGYAGQKMIGINVRFYPEGLEEALDEAAALNKPIWITETGSDIDQTDYYAKAFNAIVKCKAKGIPIMGALIWTLRDNLEWAKGDTVKFGLFHGNFEEKPAVREIVVPLFYKLTQSSLE